MSDLETTTLDDIESFIERMEALVDRWRALEEPLSEIQREMRQEASA
jgi:hypothetical protein